MFDEIPVESYITVKSIAQGSWNSKDPKKITRVYVCKICDCKFLTLTDAINHLKSKHWKTIRQIDVF
ncbi:MAG: hypothetical protein NDF52_05960 [archaeon YNP-WB-062]|nr:hypothetical protein [Candidatus Culexarchaeum yellowstonense]